MTDIVYTPPIKYTKQSEEMRLAKSFNTNLLLNGNRVALRTQFTTDNASSIIYTVPAGFKLFLYTVVLQTSESGAGGNYAQVNLNNSASQILVSLAFNAIGASVAPLLCNNPMMLKAGETIQVKHTGVAMVSIASIFGYVISDVFFTDDLV